MTAKNILLAFFIATSTPSNMKADAEVGVWDRFETFVVNTEKYADPYRDTELNVAGSKAVWDFFETLEFWKMSPRPDLVNSGFCLAKEGEEYLVYLPQRGSLTVRIAGGQYQVTWINAQDTGKHLDGGETTDGKDLFSPEQGDDWFCHLTQVKH